MTSHKLRTIVVAIAIFLITIGYVYYVFVDKPDRGGHITCYSRDGNIIYSEDVEYATPGSGGVWYIDGGVKITGDCVFIPEAE